MHLPGPVRAAVGLAASAADEARRLPDRALELPMTVVGSALQLSLRAQQRYAALTARGDAVLGGRSVGDEPPPWATFDDDPAVSDRDAAYLVDDLFGTDDPAASDPATDTDPGDSTVTPIGQASGRGAGKRTPAKKAARKTGAKKSAPAGGTGNAPTASGNASTASGNADADAASRGKTIPTPRHTAPSKFDDASDD